MIFVTLGTQDKPFPRLLEAVEKQIKKGNIKEEVIVQAGSTKYESKLMEVHDTFSMKKFAELMKEADVIITHGGVGTILTALKKDKKIIAAARLKKYGEHENDHQLQILNELEKRGNIIVLKNFIKLDEALEKISNFKPNKFESNTNHMSNLIIEYIENN